MRFRISIPKEKLQKVVFVVILTLIALGVMGNFWIAKEWSDWSSHRDEIAKLGTQIDQVQTSIRQESSNTDLRDQIKTFVDTQQQRMVTGDPFSWVVREVSLLAEKHPVRVTGMRPGEITPNAQKSRYNMFSTRLEVEGTYDQVGVFIKDFENNFSTSQIRSLEMSSLDPTRSVCRVTLECALLMLPAVSTKPTEEKKT
jgi:Tfp pilus assembly protein PilO